MSGDLIKAAKAGDLAEARRCLDAGADGKRNEALMAKVKAGTATRADVEKAAIVTGAIETAVAERKAAEREAAKTPP